jgi:hypothetical protein
MDRAVPGVLIGQRSLWYADFSPKSGNNSVVECDLAKVEVAGSNPVSRSNLRPRRPSIARATVGKPGRWRYASRRASVGTSTFTAIDDDSDLLSRALLLLRLDAAGISLHPVPTGAVAKW